MKFTFMTMTFMNHDKCTASQTTTTPPAVASALGYGVPLYVTR